MHSFVSLLAFLTVAAATPLTTTLELDNKPKLCPNITITRVTVDGDECPATGKNYIQIGDTYKTDASINFDNFNTALDTSSRTNMATVTCTVTVDLAYPLPLHQGCSNKGELFIREKGFLQIPSAGDSFTRDTAVSFSGGQTPRSAQMMSSSVPSSFKKQNKHFKAPYWDDFIDERRTKFTFAETGLGKKGRDSWDTEYLPLASMKVDLTLTLTGKSRSLASLDSFDVGVETDYSW